MGVPGPNGTTLARNWLLTNPANPASPYICQPTMVGTSGIIETGCDDPNFPGSVQQSRTTGRASSIRRPLVSPIAAYLVVSRTRMYVPPQCYPNPRQQCAVIYSVQPNLAAPLNGYMQPIIRQLNLSLVMAAVDLGR
jgi:hypothetical protein